MKWLPLYGPLIAKAAGADVPVAMLLGHVQHESGGRPDDRTKLDERGLFQVHPGTSKEMGFDHARMFQPAYAIWAGVEMFRRMANRLQKEYPALFPLRDDFFWRVVRFEFSIGSGATRKILAAMRAEHVQPRAWRVFSDYLARNRERLLHLTKHDPVKWARMVDRVFATGERLMRGGIAVESGALAIGIAAAIALYFYFRSRRGGAAMR